MLRIVSLDWQLTSPSGITEEADITGPNASPIVPDFVTQALGDFRAVDGVKAQ